MDIKKYVKKAVKKAKNSVQYGSALDLRRKATVTAADTTAKKAERAAAADTTAIKTATEKILRKKISQKDKCIMLAMESCGWSKAEAKERLERTRELTGISYDMYRRYRFFEIPEDQQQERYEEIKKSRQSRNLRDGKANRNHNKVITAATGWSEEELRERFKTAREKYGATKKDYYAFRFWEIDEAEQKEYFTQDFSHAINRRYNFHDMNRDIMLNKEVSCKVFSEYLGRPWCVNRKITPQSLRETFGGKEKIIYKPLDGNGGIGVQVFKLEPDCWEALCDELLKLPRGVVEGFVKQHPDMAAFTSASVNTLRIVTVSYNSVTGKPDPEAVDIAYVALRIGSGKSNVDNFTAGGLVAGVDLETGIVATGGVNVDGDYYETHPETGKQIKGTQIPYFREALELVRSAAHKVCGYLGWDVAISETGPVLIEVNLLPGNRILQMPYVKERKGMRSAMAKYLPTDPFCGQAEVKTTPAAERTAADTKKEQDTLTAYAERIAKETGEDQEAVTQKMRETVEEYSISCQEYYQNKLYSVPTVMIPNEVRVLQRRKNKQKKYAKRTGMSVGELSEALEDLNDTYGTDFTEKEYVELKLAQKSEANLKQLLKALKARDDLAKALHDELAEGFKKGSYEPDVQAKYNRLLDMQQKLTKDMDISAYVRVMAKWDQKLLLKPSLTKKTAADIIATTLVTDSSTTEYFRYGMRDKSVTERMTYISGKLEYHYLYGLSKKNDRALLQDKYEAYRTLKEFYGREVIKVTGMQDAALFREFVSGKTAFVKKPYGGKEGSGVQKVEVKPGKDPDALLQELLEECRGAFVCEELVVQHESIAAFNRDSVNTVRVLTYNTGSEIGVINCGIMRMGNKGSFIDNASAGGIAVAYDSDTGILISDGGNQAGDRYPVHPASGKKLKGFQLPDWEQARTVVCAAAKKLPKISIVGWDLVYTQTGKWIVIEANTGPGLTMAQALRPQGCRKEIMEAVEKCRQAKA